MKLLKNEERTQIMGNDPHLWKSTEGKRAVWLIRSIALYYLALFIISLALPFGVDEQLYLFAGEPPFVFPDSISGLFGTTKALEDLLRGCYIIGVCCATCHFCSIIFAKAEKDFSRILKAVSTANFKSLAVLNTVMVLYLLYASVRYYPILYTHAENANGEAIAAVNTAGEAITYLSCVAIPLVMLAVAAIIAVVLAVNVKSLFPRLSESAAILAPSKR